MNVPPPPYIETTATSLTQSTSLNVPTITQTFYTDSEGDWWELPLGDVHGPAGRILQGTMMSEDGLSWSGTEIL
uniref:Uncharacterized protein n=1 Tax=Meloidogyne javanica TaxID=6303 RepID=A0A915MQB4_MELJA